MIRKIITGKLKALTGIHIGSGDSTEITDSPIHRNVEGEIIIPGTAIAGSLRTLATRIAPHMGFNECIVLDKTKMNKFCDCPVCELFGSINPDDNSERGSASKIWIYNAILENEINPSIRDGVGIDRETKSASSKKRAKYDFETVPKGSEFTFQIDIQNDVDKIKENILASVLTEWENGRCYLGGMASRGMGKMQLIDTKASTIDLSSIKNLMTFLKHDEPLKSANEEEGWLKNKAEEARKLIKYYANNIFLFNSFIQIDFILNFNGGYVINDILKATQSGFDFCPKKEGNEFILPGSSLRGILRFQAEKIARSLTTLNSESLNDFLIKCPACNPFADANTPLTSCNDIINKYKYEYINEVHLCMACQLFGSTSKGSRLYVNDSYLNNEPQIKIMDFLAIDRFTGGGKDSAKFDALVLWQPSFKASIFIENPKEWQMGWLMLVLKDINDGLASIGFGQNKWFGKATTENVIIKVGAISDLYIPDGLKIKANDSFEGIFNTKSIILNELIDAVDKPVDHWIKEFQRTLTDFRRDNDLILSSDTYFKDEIIVLYPKEVNVYEHS